MPRSSAPPRGNAGGRTREEPMLRRRAVTVAIAIALPFPAAAWPPYRLHPEYAARAGAVRTVGVVTPHVVAYDASQGVLVPREDWSARISGNLLAAVQKQLRRRNLFVKHVDPLAVAAAEELREALLLYVAVEGAIVQATYENDFLNKKGAFDYSVGDLATLLAAAEVDGVIFVHATTINGSRGELPDRVFVGMVDRSGSVVWFSHDHATTTDLRDPEDAALFAKNLIEPLPRWAR